MSDINLLQFGIDIGRVPAHTKRAGTPDELRSAVQKVVDALGIDVVLDEEPSMLLGLGWGLADRRKIPVEKEALEVMGSTGVEEEEDSEEDIIGSE